MAQLTHSRLLVACLLLALAIVEFVASEQPQQRSRKAPYHCKHPTYQVHIYSRSPLVIYISDFITKAEREHLLQVTQDTFTRSLVTGLNSSGTGRAVNSVRTSSSTSVPHDAVARCIEQRVLDFQGPFLSNLGASSGPSASGGGGPSEPRDRVENLQLVRYHHGEHYNFHTDWFTDYFSPHAATPDQGGNRVSSFFAYVSVNDDIAGGGTNFPLLNAPRDADGAWCHIVDCDEEWEKGVTFRPVEGNAVFWANIDEETGKGDPRVLHAGLPVQRGEKVGMNMWTREGKVAGKWPDVD